ncbi:MAG: GNAT family N-acetyltransferase [Verrucomicrobiota bacterium]|nr:GNAT family N-acetyltransferase [Verrucomicrobiota bacterium]
MPELTTPRLHLRSFQDDDLDAFAILTANPDFMRFSGGGGLDRERTAALLERVMVRTRIGLPALFAVFDRAEAKLIGYCGFLPQTVDGVEELEIGYRLHPNWWGRGLATEAATAVRDYAFGELGRERVISLIHVDNTASRRVVEKLGMRLEKHTDFKGFPTAVFALTRGDCAQRPSAAR